MGSWQSEGWGSGALGPAPAVRIDSYRLALVPPAVADDILARRGALQAKSRNIAALSVNFCSATYTWFYPQFS